MTLIVISSEERCSKPCKECLRVIKKCGIKKIIYRDENGELIKVNINKIDEETCKYTKSYYFNEGRKKL